VIVTALRRQCHLLAALLEARRAVFVQLPDAVRTGDAYTVIGRRNILV
jgi:hypothetical protein